jgi:hypothetical protein
MGGTGGKGGIGGDAVKGNDIYVVPTGSHKIVKLSSIANPGNAD